MFNDSRSVVIGLALAWGLAACGGGGHEDASSPASTSGTPKPPVEAPAPQLPDPSAAPALKTEFAAYFKIGAAAEIWQIDPATNAADVALLKKHFSSVTAANVMKADTIGTEEGKYNFEPADRLIAFAEANGIAVRGHTLVWETTSPDWFFAGDRSDPTAYREVVRNRLKTYVSDVVTHFKGKIYAWDVVNEAVGETVDSPYRTDTRWYEAYSVAGMAGEDYIEDAFRAAKAADPDAKLFLNDFNTETPVKRQNLLKVLQDLIDKGIPIDGVGHQLHSYIYVQPSAVDTTLTAVEQLDSTLINEITELDLTIYTDPTSDYGLQGPPVSILSQQAQAYRSLFGVFRAHDASIDSVTTWGISDAETWLNYWRTNRTDRPLLFDRDGNPKWAFWAIVEPALQLP